MADNAPLTVELRGITKQYPGSGKKANSGINLGLRRGEILCIAGENGAGKTTLMKILAGLEKADAGEIFINGKKEEIDTPAAAKNLGIGMVHQHFMLFHDYTVAENMVMGAEPRKWGIFFDAKKAEAEAARIIDEHNFPVNARDTVKDLTVGQMQQVEICSILYRNAEIIILDEPTSMLTEQETSSLFKTLKKLAASGKSLILITHKLNEIKQVCDRVAVLRRGEAVNVCGASLIDEYEIARMMTGDNVRSYSYSSGGNNSRSNAEPAIVFDNVTVLQSRRALPLLDNVSFAASPGEILGFAGVSGNGLGVLEAVLGGFLHPSSGKILHRGKDISALNIRRLRSQGLAYVPADRLHVGSAPGATVEENMLINRRAEFKKGIVIDKKAAGEFTRGLKSSYNIEGPQDAKAGFLSGGNLQKLILAREIDWFKDYIVFSQPTWGLDIAWSRFVMQEIAALKEKGAAVILISTNLDEITALADRIMVLYRGRIAGVFANNGEASVKQAVGNCMQGLGRAGQ